MNSSCGCGSGTELPIEREIPTGRVCASLQDGNGCKEDGGRRRPAVYLLAAEGQEGNSGQMVLPGHLERRRNQGTDAWNHSCCGLQPTEHETHEG
jgi:hypothetical protein